MFCGALATEQDDNYLQSGGHKEHRLSHQPYLSFTVKACLLILCLNINAGHKLHCPHIEVVKKKKKVKSRHNHRHHSIHGIYITEQRLLGRLQTRKHLFTSEGVIYTGDWSALVDVLVFWRFCTHRTQFCTQCNKVI